MFACTESPRRTTREVSRWRGQTPLIATLPAPGFARAAPASSCPSRVATCVGARSAFSPPRVRLGAHSPRQTRGRRLCPRSRLAPRSSKRGVRSRRKTESACSPPRPCRKGSGESRFRHPSRTRAPHPRGRSRVSTTPKARRKRRSPRARRDPATGPWTKRWPGHWSPLRRTLGTAAESLDPRRAWRVPRGPWEDPRAA